MLRLLDSCECFNICTELYHCSWKAALCVWEPELVTISNYQLLDNLTAAASPEIDNGTTTSSAAPVEGTSTLATATAIPEINDGTSTSTHVVETSNWTNSMLWWNFSVVCPYGATFSDESMLLFIVCSKWFLFESESAQYTANSADLEFVCRGLLKLRIPASFSRMAPWLIAKLKLRVLLWRTPRWFLFPWWDMNPMRYPTSSGAATSRACLLFPSFGLPVLCDAFASNELRASV